MRNDLKNIIILVGAALLLTTLIWLPHILKVPIFYGLDFSQGFSTIYRNYDGLNYVVVAKTFYNPQSIAQIPQSLPATYFPAHFPLYPIFIAFLAPILGFLKSMLFVSILFTILSTLAFYFLLKDLKLTSNPLWLSIVFLFIPARWVIVHSVGSPEPMFDFFTILAIYFFAKFHQNPKQSYIWLAALSASFAQLTRPPGILLFLALGIYIVYEFIQKRNMIAGIKILPRYLPLVMVPLALVGLFVLFYFSTGNFWAYFHTGDNIHLTFPPFQVFNKAQYWVGDIWLEDIIYIFLLGFLGGILLLRQKLLIPGIFVLTYLGASILVAHRDIARYTIPIFPFLLIAFERVLVSKEFKIALAIIFLGIYLYSQNFILNNTAPIPNLEVFN